MSTFLHYHLLIIVLFFIWKTISLPLPTPVYPTPDLLQTNIGDRYNLYTLLSGYTITNWNIVYEDIEWGSKNM